MITIRAAKQHSADSRVSGVFRGNGLFEMTHCAASSGRFLRRSDHMTDRIQKLRPLFFLGFAVDFHKPDRRSNLTSLTFTALTHPAALFEIILVVPTPLGCDFWAQVAPTWAPGPTPTLEKPRFSLCFLMFNFNQKSAQRRHNGANVGPRPTQGWPK